MEAAILRVGYVRAMRRERVFRDRENPIDYFNDDQLYVRYRFGRRNILFILSLIENRVAHFTKRSMALPALFQFLICLRFLGCGSFLTVIGDTIPRVSKSTVCRCVRQVCLALHAIMPEIIKMPGTQRLQAAKAGFSELAGKIGRSRNC
jgi:hypothetical protein